jgi:metal-responsive CopG/Arc/MetJ family transcriptional regulator
MRRTQIQFPDPLFAELKRVSRRLDWSLAEVVRRASENFVARFPQEELGGREPGGTWSFPVFDDMEEYRTDPARLRPESDAIIRRGEPG